MRFTPNRAQVMSIVRHALTVIGAVVVERGLASAETTMTVTGSVMAIAGLLWSHIEHNDSKESGSKDKDVN